MQEKCIREVEKQLEKESEERGILEAQLAQVYKQLEQLKEENRVLADEQNRHDQAVSAVEKELLELKRELRRSAISYKQLEEEHL